MIVGSYRSKKVLKNPLIERERSGLAKMLKSEVIGISSVILKYVLHFTFLYRSGKTNALSIVVEEKTFKFRNLPSAFDNFRILFITDPHIDAIDELGDVLVKSVKEIQADLCLLGGDYRMAKEGPIAESMSKMGNVVRAISSNFGILGILGNHDSKKMIPFLDSFGVKMLINDKVHLQVNGDRIWIVGVDDPHFFQQHDLPIAFNEVPKEDFVIFLAHSPELFDDVVDYHPDLYLCGHTHGGQIRLPFLPPIVTASRAPRWTSAGEWHHKGITGYTSRGCGVTYVPVRFNCPPEITIITLRR